MAVAAAARSMTAIEMATIVRFIRPFELPEARAGCGCPASSVDGIVGLSDVPVAAPIRGAQPAAADKGRILTRALVGAVWAGTTWIIPQCLQRQTPLAKASSMTRTVRQDVQVICITKVL